ncbi:Rnu3ip2 protein [Pluteus cervinus]|uniref:Rnu3ip2 protein n=1 Tax=Pluteus cervinus TaxID=181527 RepID=A0ACD3AZH7_9AGAR|nr:Rnu3ip2 protein [Pluteus cervinus]
MPDAFFVSNKSKKRKRPTSSSNNNVTNGASKPRSRGGPSGSRGPGSKLNGVQKKRNAREDEELDSDKTDGENIDDMDLRADEGEEGSGEEDENETPAEKRLRLANLYLESVKDDLADGEFDAAEIDKEIISTRLKQDVLEHSGKVHQFVADAFDLSSPPTAVLRTRGHRFSVTSATASESGKFLFTAGKEGSIIKWDLSTGKKVSTFHKQRPSHLDKGKGKAQPDDEVKGHTDEVLALALSSDGKYLASGGKDKRVCVWDAEKSDWVKSFKGPMCHRDSVSALSFRKSTHSLYSASFDRTIKVFDLSPSVMGYVETLFGHQDQVLSLDALRRETCVSAGARDKTVRFWKIVDETQLVFRGGGKSKIRDVLEGGLRADGDGDDSDDEVARARKKKRLDVPDAELAKKFVEGSIECVALLDENMFVSGGDSGVIALWTTQKKKPIFTYPLAHGLNKGSLELDAQTPRWVTSLSCLRYSDTFASGSWDGHIRIWRVDPSLKSFSPIGSIPALGVINSLQLISPPSESLQKAPWAATAKLPHHSTPKGEKRNPVLLVAGLGKEHRFGRWLNLQDEGVFNGAMVFILPQRT